MEVILKWEVQRIREESDQTSGEGSSTPGSVSSDGIKRSASVESPQDPKRARHQSAVPATVRILAHRAVRTTFFNVPIRLMIVVFLIAGK